MERPRWSVPDRAGREELHREERESAKEQKSLTAKDSKDAKEKEKLYREGENNKVNSKTR